MLAEVLRAPAAMRAALGAVLGEEAEAVIVDSPSLALRAIEILKETRAGRLSFIPEPGPADSHPSIVAPGIAGRLIDMLDVDPRFCHVAEAMLGHVVVADDLRSALAASNLNGHGTLFVTREGDLVSPGRLIAGGSGATAEDGARKRRPRPTRRRSKRRPPRRSRPRPKPRRCARPSRRRAPCSRRRIANSARDATTYRARNVRQASGGAPWNASIASWRPLAASTSRLVFVSRK